MPNLKLKLNFNLVDFHPLYYSLLSRHFIWVAFFLSHIFIIRFSRRAFFPVSQALAVRDLLSVLLLRDFLEVPDHLGVRRPDRHVLVVSHPVLRSAIVHPSSTPCLCPVAVHPHTESRASTSYPLTITLRPSHQHPLTPRRYQTCFRGSKVLVLVLHQHLTNEHHPTKVKNHWNAETLISFYNTKQIATSV